LLLGGWWRHRARGVSATRPLLLARFTGEARAHVSIVRILFPGIGLLVLSAWCLGILNSHHKFLLSYTAPVMWNAAMIATLVIYGAHLTLPRLAVALAWGSVVGSALQFVVQVPVVLAVAPDLRLAADIASEHVRIVAQLPACVRQPRRCSGERISTPCWRACCRRAPSPGCRTRSCFTPCR
jgi:hypothetical protein